MVVVVAVAVVCTAMSLIFVIWYLGFLVMNSGRRERQCGHSETSLRSYWSYREKVVVVVAEGCLSVM